MHKKIINHEQQPINGQPNGLKVVKKYSKSEIIFMAAGVLLAVIIGIVISSIIWYNVQLRPVGNDLGEMIKVEISPGSNSTQIGNELKKQSIIRSATAFDIYIRLSGKSNVLQAGVYRLSPAESSRQIVEHFVKGNVDRFSITFYPGSTLIDKTDKPESKKLDVTTVLKKAGFSEHEISTALGKKYDSPLFAGKPANADLEGYIYSETYNFNVGATVEDILKGTFEEFYNIIQKNNLIKGFASHGLDLYQGITLASIVQREANGADDQKQVAQVFYSRLSSDMMLGSDVTYQYIADKTGVARDTKLDSPYNTRLYAGMPPGPISNPGLSALIAVASPASGDYLYFLSGDDDITYFAMTNGEHEANIVKHCKIKCSTP